ncbi:hypothetical protein GCM10027286_13510 [Virgibacillus ainsalahensis]
MQYFHLTRMGHDFFCHHTPLISKSLKEITVEIKRANELKEKELEMKEMELRMKEKELAFLNTIASK